jgi:protein-tyrosine phosphatase
MCFQARISEHADVVLCYVGKILVHCRQGVSRSASLVIAYLVMKKDMHLVEACQLVRYFFLTCFYISIRT